MSFIGRLPKDQRPQKKRIRLSKLPEGYMSLAEQQEMRLSGKVINETASSFLTSKFSVDDLFEVGCIYYLFLEKQIVYIGQTKNILERISKHYRNRKMIFDSFKIQKFDGSDKQRLAKEASLIFKYKPIYNESSKTRKKKDALDCRTTSMTDCKMK